MTTTPEPVWNVANKLVNDQASLFFPTFFPRTFPLIVPLGGNCFPRWSATNLGYKKRKSEGEPSFPFDLGIWPMPMVRYLIENDFEGMADPANLLLRADEEGRPVLCDRRFPSGSYNHEMPPNTDTDFTVNNFENFAKRYENRINNFRAAVSAAPQVLLYLTATNLIGEEDNPYSMEDFQAIIHALSLRYPGTQFKMLVVVERFPGVLHDSWDGTIRIFNFHMHSPYTDYIEPLMFTMIQKNILGSVLASFH